MVHGVKPLRTGWLLCHGLPRSCVACSSPHANLARYVNFRVADELKVDLGNERFRIEFRGEAFLLPSSNSARTGMEAIAN